MNILAKFYCRPVRGHFTQYLLLTHQWRLSVDPFEEWCDNATGTLMSRERRQTGAGGWAGRLDGLMEAGKNAPLTWCFGTVVLLWGWYRKPVLFGAEEGGVPPWRERMTEQRDTVWLPVTQPVFPALSGVNMEGWIGGNGHEKSLEGRRFTVEGLQLQNIY